MRSSRSALHSFAGFEVTDRQLEQQEVTDRLTGTLNHRRLLETLDYEIGRHAYHGRWLALLLLDVQGLDSINRSYGRRTLREG